MTPEARALLRQDELEMLEDGLSSPVSRQVESLCSRLAASRAGERELRGKASEIKSIRDKFHAKHFLDEGDTELMDSLICEIALMAELFPVAESETK